MYWKLGTHQNFSGDDFAEVFALLIALVVSLLGWELFKDFAKGWRLQYRINGAR